ncbi:hypothetical protein [Nocardia nepalensis]|uniref:hypothetical protein n=1 Tax=Nocardia nepalensis TaxID=3375448 RepID=UPI003B66CF1B
MSRRKTFDPGEVPIGFWHRDDVRLALARREVGRLFGIYLGEFPACTQAQLALLTEHDRSDISNFIRGARSPRVTDIDVLNRIADGLDMPDEARTLVGLAPREPAPAEHRVLNPLPKDGEATVTGWYRPVPAARPLRIAICGSRSPSCNLACLDEAIHALSRLLMNRRCEVDHGPVGIGIETMTYIADHYRPPTLRAAVGVFGRSNVVRHADFVLVIGGGPGTLDEVDLAISMGKRIIPFICSGGAARHALDRMNADVSLRAWMSENSFAALSSCASADEYAKIVEQLFAETESRPSE